MNAEATQSLSIVSGPPLSEEPGLGTLTLPGFLRDVTSMYGDREALAFRAAGGETRWTYTELWERAVEVACALRASGVGKDTRVGVLMTNRPEWISAFFGITLAGGVAVTLSTFSTPAELEYLLNSSCVAVLLVRAKGAEEGLRGPSVRAGTSDRARLLPARCNPRDSRSSVISPRSAMRRSGIDTWDAFLARGHDEPRELVQATAEAVRPSDAAVLFFSSGSTSKPKGILSAHRGVAIQMWRFRRVCGFGPERQCPLLVGERLLLVRQFRDVAGRHARRRRLPRPAADVRCGRGARTDGGRAGELSVRLAAPVGAGRRRTQLAQRRLEQHAVRRRQDTDRPPSDGVDRMVRARPRLRQHRNIHDQHHFPARHAARGARRQLGRGAARRDDQDRGSAHRQP